MSTSWWRMSLRAHPLARLLRNWSGPLIWTGTALTASGCAEILAQNDQSEPPVGLEAQQQDGWNTGSEGQPLVFTGAQSVDVSGGTGWQAARTQLVPRLMPADPRWQPYYGPTLFQSLEAARNEDLRNAIRPVYTAQMHDAYQRGEALLSLFIENGRCRQDVALVVDLPGPEAIALAAPLARCFDPVFMLDNWPHPKGVVPAHLTLGAALYFLPSFEGTRAGRTPVAPPVFILDRRRLTPYTDDAGQFDNRYFAGLPSWEGLHAAGIRRLLYVTPDATVLDAYDLNGDLVDLDQNGIDVKMVALSDFSQTPLPGWLDDPGNPCSPAQASGPGPHYYFGGSPASHGCFNWWYGWQSPQISLNVSLSNNFHRLPPIPPGLVPRCRFRPTPHAAPALGGAHPPGGWAGGHWTQGLSGRSGSMGRAHGGFSS
jgi:hypothetical protein